ncbi:MAG: hypothetical protein R2761_23375 [Acidimicrobiales bacterium]
MTRYRVSSLLRDGLLDEPVPGLLRVRGARRTWQQRLSVAAHAAGGAIASHRSAARLHGLDGLRHQLVIEVSVPRARRHRLAGVITHHVTPLDPADVTMLDGIPCTTLARTLADLGAVVRPFSVQQALTDARRRRIDLVSVRSVAERLHRPGPTGTGVLLRLLDAIPHEGRVPDSWLEELLAACVADPRLPPVIPQYEIRDARGLVAARTDLGIPAVRLGLEGHSRQFHFGPLQEPRDEQRDLRVAACGWELLYLGWYAAQRPEQVARRVREVVRARRRDEAA